MAPLAAKQTLRRFSSQHFKNRMRREWLLHLESCRDFKPLTASTQITWTPPGYQSAEVGSETCLSAPLLGTSGGALITPFPRVTLARHKFPIPHTQVIRWAQWMLAPQDCRVPSMARALQSFLPPSRQAMYFLSKYGLNIALNGH